MEEIWSWILENKWLFSGIGGLIVVSVFGFLIKRTINSKKIIQKQKSGDTSTNVQIGESLNINADWKKRDD